MVTQARENILQKIKQALEKPVPLPFKENNNPIFNNTNEDLTVQFAQNFTELQGKFSFCITEGDLALQISTLAQINNWTKIICKEESLTNTLSKNGFSNFNYTDLATCQVSITSCEYLVARTGSIVLSSASTSGRNTSVYAPIHICIAYNSQLVYDISDGLLLMQQKYAASLPSLITLATGPSRTADIEKTLVVGVHGPKQVYVFLVDDVKK